MRAQPGCSAVGGERVRKFSADEIVAFSMGFGVPVMWFFLPPAAGLRGEPTLIETPDVADDKDGHVPGAYLDDLFGRHSGRGDFGSGSR